MITTGYLFSFFEALDPFTISEAIIFYLLGYVLVSILKNIFGTETPENFNFNRKFALGSSLVYIMLSITQLDPFSEKGLFTTLVSAAALAALASVFIYFIVNGKKFKKAYFLFYCYLIATIKLLPDIEQIKVCGCLSFHSGKRFAVNQVAYKRHLASILPLYLIALILLSYALAFGWIISLITVCFLSVFLATSYFIEFESAEIQTTDKHSWFFKGNSSMGWGAVLKENLSVVEKTSHIPGKKFSN